MTIASKFVGSTGLAGHIEDLDIEVQETSTGGIHVTWRGSGHAHVANRELYEAFLPVGLDPDEIRVIKVDTVEETLTLLWCIGCGATEGEVVVKADQFSRGAPLRIGG